MAIIESDDKHVFSLLRRFLLLPLLLFTLSPAANCTAAGEASEAISEMEVEELLQVEVNTVYGASRYLQDLSEAPASVSIVTADDIRKFGFRSLADILQSVRGFSITYDRNYYYAGFRGFNRPGDYGTRFLLQIDGIRVNDAVYDALTIGPEFPLDVDLIDHVEIIRGPGQSIYGSNAFFGIINVVTRQGKAVGGGEASLSAESYSTYGGRLTYGKRFKGLGYLFSGSFTNSKGQNLFFEELATPQFNNGWSNGNDGVRFGSGFAKLSFGDFTLEGAVGESHKHVPTNAWGTIFNDRRNSTIDNVAVAALKYEHAFADNLDVMSMLSANWYMFRGDYPYANDTPPPDDYVGKDKSKGDWVAWELLLKKEFNRHILVAGGEIRDCYRQYQSYVDISGRSEDSRSQFSWGVYLQDEYQLLDNLIVNFGGRYDHFNTFGGTFNPRIALIYSPFEKTTLKLIYGRAFKAPTDYELNAPGNGSKSSLSEERLTSFKAIVEQKFGAYLGSSINFYQNRLHGVITQDAPQPTDLNIPFSNAPDFGLRGIEMEVDGKWPNGFIARANYSLQSAFDLQNNAGLPNFPRQLAKFALAVPLMSDKLFLGIEEQYTGSRRTLDDRKLRGYWLTNATLSATGFLPSLEISFSVYNLFDQSYSVPGAGEHLQGGISAIEQDGRSFRGKLTYRF